MIEMYEYKYESIIGWLRLIGKFLVMTRDIENGFCVDGGSLLWFYIWFIWDRFLGELGMWVYVD